MKPYIQRTIDPLIEELFSELPALSIVGPRACGKTTSAARHVENVIRLDKPDQAEAFRCDPDAAINALSGPTLFDEWQEVPEILGAIKRSIDADSSPGRFILTGSVRAELDVATWPGTGRVVPLAMYPLTERERAGTTGPSLIAKLARNESIETPSQNLNLVDYVEMAMLGGFPEIESSMSVSARQRWLEGYVTQTVSRDAPGIGRADTDLLRRYLGASSLHTAGVVDQSAIASDVGIDRKTGAAYDALLQRLMLCDVIPAWTTNRLKRLIRSPKRFVTDCSLLTGLFGIDVAGVLADGKLLGRIIETFVMSQLRVEQVVSPLRFRLHHVRQQNGRSEIDFLIEIGAGSLIGVEVKASNAPTAKDARHLEWLRENYPDRFIAGVVLHTGQNVFSLGDKITAIPISCLWS